VLAVALAWTGGSLVALSDGRRGLALGLLLAASAIGLAQNPVQTAAQIGLIVGLGVAGAGLLLLQGPTGWGTLAAGSTPRLIASLGALFVPLAFWAYALSRLGGPALLCGLLIATTGAIRVLSAGSRAPALAGLALLALGAGAMAGSPWVFYGGLAAGLVLLPSPVPIWGRPSED